MNEALVIFRSNIGYYSPRKNGARGWEHHPVAILWKGHELQLAKYGKELAREFLYNRPLAQQRSTESLESRRLAFSNWTKLINELEERNFPDTLPSLIGEEDFHSAFRASLLYKEHRGLTYKKFKQGSYPNHAIIRALPPHIKNWKRQDFELVWQHFGKPELVWYSKFGWTEEPDDRNVFYSEDRKTIFQDRTERQTANPIQPWYKKKEKPDANT
jgi:hypothetical protein